LGLMDVIHQPFSFVQE